MLLEADAALFEGLDDLLDRARDVEANLASVLHGLQRAASAEKPSLPRHDGQASRSRMRSRRGERTVFWSVVLTGQAGLLGGAKEGAHRCHHPTDLIVGHAGEHR